MNLGIRSTNNLPAKGDVSHLSTGEILQLEQSFKADQNNGAFKVGQRYLYPMIMPADWLMADGYCCKETAILSWQF
jgi:hypothetical protein